ncbi:proteoglycan 4-like [Gouania willdenowi]|uniref:proteoglycan 4-like n=1 Tax=Gouania willdenowi TaxID=441366 RepID=UPI0010559280|nr:proteoglycan 4-like [Gouania willdenowi]
MTSGAALGPKRPPGQQKEWGPRSPRPTHYRAPHQTPQRPQSERQPLPPTHALEKAPRNRGSNAPRHRHQPPTLMPLNPHPHPSTKSPQGEGPESPLPETPAKEPAPQTGSQLVPASRPRGSRDQTPGQPSYQYATGKAPLGKLPHPSPQTSHHPAGLPSPKCRKGGHPSPITDWTAQATGRRPPPARDRPMAATTRQRQTNSNPVRYSSPQPKAPGPTHWPADSRTDPPANSIIPKCHAAMPQPKHRRQHAPSTPTPHTGAAALAPHIMGSTPRQPRNKTSTKPHPKGRGTPTPAIPTPPGETP